MIELTESEEHYSGVGKERSFCFESGMTTQHDHVPYTDYSYVSIKCTQLYNYIR